MFKVRERKVALESYITRTIGGSVAGNRLHCLFHRLLLEGREILRYYSVKDKTFKRKRKHVKLSNVSEKKQKS